MKKLNKKGFTIVELVIVIAVIAILAAVMIPTFSGIIEKANIVKNLTINTSKRFVALFGQVKNATIKNLGIESSTFRQQGNFYAAGIVSLANNSEISGCFVKNTTVNVKCASGSNGQYAGGIVAQGIGATTISDCYVKGITLKTEKRFYLCQVYTI